MGARLPEAGPKYDQSYQNQLIRDLRNELSSKDQQLKALQTQIDTINAILARHHIT